jgi:virginiamycin B lyase
VALRRWSEPVRTSRRIGRLVPACLLAALLSPSAGRGAVFREITLPTPNTGPTAIGGSPAHSLWFIESQTNRIGRRNPDGSIQEFTVPTPDSGLEGITPYTDSAGRFGFTEFRANKIGRIEPSGQITEFAIPAANSGPRGITVGDAHSFWFTEFNADKIGRMSFQGQFIEYPLTPGARPVGITWGPSDDGNGEAWYTEFGTNRIGRMNPNSQSRNYQIPTPDSGPTGITWDTAADGGENVWFTEFNANKIGRITTQGVITEFAIPTPDSGPTGIVARTDGIWFTESRANKIGRWNRDGTFTEFPIPTANSWPAAITSDLWFTERDGNKLATVDKLVAVGAGFSGTWDTEFELANGEGRNVRVSVGLLDPFFCQVGCYEPARYLDIPAHGTARISSREVPYVAEAVQTFYVSLAERIDVAEFPTTRARIVNRARPTQAIEIPVVRLSRLEEMNPVILAFPGAARSPTTHSNLILAEVGRDSPVAFRVEALDSAGTSRGSRDFFLQEGKTLFLIDALHQLGVDALDGGQIRVTKTGGIGLMWGLLATLTEDGDVSVSVGTNP